LVKPINLRRSIAAEDILPNENQKRFHLFIDSFVKPLRPTAPCRLSRLSNLAALTIQFQIRDLFYAKISDDPLAALKKLDAVVLLLKQFLRTSTNLKKLNMIFLMAGGVFWGSKPNFFDELDELLGINGRLVRGRSRGGGELFDDNGVLITGPRATDRIYNYSRTDEFEWAVLEGMGLRVAKETERFTKDGEPQWF
jgi:hypothetical protein